MHDAIALRLYRQEKLQSLLKSFNLLLAFVNADVKSRHRDKILGLLWTILDPFMLMLVYLFVVMLVFKQRSPDFPIYLYTGIFAWRYFAISTQSASTCMIANRGLLLHSYFPRVLIPLSRVMVSAYEFFFAGIGLICLYIYLGYGISWPVLAIIPIFLIQTLFNVGIALICASIGVLFKDFSNILTFIMRLGWYLSPGLYYVSQIPEHYQKLYMLNPMAVFFTLYRDVTLYKTWPDPNYLMYALAWSILFFALGLFVFKKSENILVRSL